MDSIHNLDVHDGLCYIECNSYVFFNSITDSIAVNPTNTRNLVYIGDI